MDSCILYQNAEHTITIIDIPRSIEEAQGFSDGDKKHIISSTAIEEPFASVEPKSAKALRNAEPASIKSLLLERFLQIALEDIHTVFKGLWCSPRITEKASREVSQVFGWKTSITSKDTLSPTLPTSNENISPQSTPNSAKTNHSHSHTAFESHITTTHLFHQNPTPTTQHLHITTTTPNSIPLSILVPPRSTLLHGPISTTTPIFTSTAPLFSLVILDPPWPNRSASRSGSYSVSPDIQSVTSLLASIPLAEYLADDALVGVWVTNKATVWEVVLGSDGGGGDGNGGGRGGGGKEGLFESWDVDLIEEWVWLKTTSKGEPICALGSTWRKAYEVLLVGRKRSSSPEIITTNTADANNNNSISSSNTSNRAEIKRRVLIAVPDLHSRKPNLKPLFEPLLPPTYEALEIFARNLTAGWWGWGDEVLKFQDEEECWV